MCLCLYCVPDHIRTRASTHQNKSASSLSGAINIHIFMGACGAPSTKGHSFENSSLQQLCWSCFKHDLKPEVLQTFDQATSEAYGIEPVEVIGSEFVVLHAIFQNFISDY
jgi:hypothetical protein